MSHVRVGVSAALSMALWLGCAGRTQPPEERPDMTSELELMSGYPAGTDPVYADLAERELAADEAFQRAWEAYSAGRYREAARDFMDAAAALADQPGQPLRELFAENRRVCYANAERAFRRASATAEARAALTSAAASDPLNEPALRGMIARLPP